MPREILSRKTRSEFREYMTGWVLGQITKEFESAYIEPRTNYNPPHSGQRRCLIEQYYAALDFTKIDDVNKVLVVFETVLEIAFGTDEKTGKRLVSLLERDGFEFRDHRIRRVAGTVALTQIKELAASFDAEHMASQVKRIEEAVDDDPSLAIGSAKELLETCCRTILAERKQQAPPNMDLVQLVKATAKELRLLPENIPDNAKGVEIIRRMLSNLGSVAQGLAELRNLYGSGHGRDGRARGLRPRHARLAVGSSVALTLFLFETHQELPIAEAPTVI